MSRKHRSSDYVKYINEHEKIFFASFSAYNCEQNHGSRKLGGGGCEKGRQYTNRDRYDLPNIPLQKK